MIVRPIVVQQRPILIWTREIEIARVTHPPHAYNQHMHTYQQHQRVHISEFAGQYGNIEPHLLCQGVADADSM